MRRLRAAVGSAAFVIVVSCLWLAFLATTHLQSRDTFLDTIEHRLLDWRYKIVGPVAAASDLVFVAIDDATLAGQTDGLAGRRLIAQVIEEIANNNANLLVLDVLLADAGVAEERQELAQALTRLPSIIAAAARFGPQDPAPTIIWPHDDFMTVAEVGLVNLYTDPSRIPRFMPLFLDVDGTVFPSMPLLAAIDITQEQARITDHALSLGALEVPLDSGANLPLRLLGPAGTVPTLSATNVLTGQAAPLLSGKAVILGFSAAGTGDLFASPFQGEVPGGEIIATAISQLTGGPTLRYDSQTRGWDVAHAVALTVLCLVVMLRAPLVRAVPLALTVVLLSFGGLTFLFAQGLWLSAALPLGAAVPALGFAGLYSLVRDRKSAQLSDQRLASLRRFQSPGLARKIEEDPNYLLTPQEQDLAIFFVDLTGFTALSQKLGAEGTRALLQRFHGLTARAAEQHNGSVINFMGDGALVVFGMDPSPPGQSVADAALASALMLEKDLANMPAGDDHAPVTCRSGLHYGSAILSRLGADNHQQVTVSGDAVNLASRLMEVAKSKGAKIAATAEFTAQLEAQSALENTTSTTVTVRGRSGDVGVILWPI